MSKVLKSVDYEILGRVQGVCFRMYTEEKARKVGVVGWIRNSREGTVTGQVQGPEDKVNEICNCHSASTSLSSRLPLDFTAFRVLSGIYGPMNWIWRIKLQLP
uniref:acylphosphatase n=1 Tax=Anolis carolinensis TaxID=28377 RepID=G1KM45_ANOCA